MFLDYHTHLENGPYTKEWALKFVETAVSRGISEIGFSEHVYRFKQAVGIVDHPWATERCTEDLPEYVDLVLSLKEEGLPVKLALEVDYSPEKEDQIRELISRYPFDYVLGSIHWLGEWGFDNPDFAGEWDLHDLLDVYRRYFTLLTQAASSGLFHILSHPDVIKVFGHRPQGDLTELYRPAIQAISAAKGLCIEVSTAGLRKPVGRLYPEPEFLKMAFEAGVPVTLASDAHYPEDVGKDYHLVASFLREAGYLGITRFTEGQGEQVSLG